MGLVIKCDIVAFIKISAGVMMQNNRETKAREILRQFKFHCTAGQVAVLGVLLDADCPLSQEEIAGRMSGQADRATIYRILERFCQKGLVHQAFVDGRAVRYELGDRCTDSQCHPHFLCDGCGEVFCMDDVTVPLAEGLGKGFVLRRQKVMIEGLCPECC